MSGDILYEDEVRSRFAEAVSVVGDSELEKAINETRFISGKIEEIAENEKALEIVDKFFDGLPCKDRVVLVISAYKGRRGFDKLLLGVARAIYWTGSLDAALAIVDVADRVLEVDDSGRRGYSTLEHLSRVAKTSSKERILSQAERYLAKY